MVTAKKSTHIFLPLFYAIALLLPVLFVPTRYVNKKLAPLELEVAFFDIAPGVSREISKTIILPRDTFLVSFTPNLESSVDDIVHHANLKYSGAQNPHCPLSNAYLASAGSEMRNGAILPGYGIPVKRGESLTLYAHLVNHGDKNAQGAFRFILKEDSAVTSAFPVHLSIADYCVKRFADFAIPASASHYERRMDRPFFMPADRKLLGWTGHIHQYGSGIRLLRNGVLISTLFPEENPHRQHGSRSIYLPGKSFLDSPIAFMRGDVVDIEVVYDKPPGLPDDDAMGIAYLIFDGSWQ